MSVSLQRWFPWIGMGVLFVVMVAASFVVNKYWLNDNTDNTQISQNDDDKKPRKRKRGDKKNDNTKNDVTKDKTDKDKTKKNNDDKKKPTPVVPAAPKYTLAATKPGDWLLYQIKVDKEKPSQLREFVSKNDDTTVTVQIQVPDGSKFTDTNQVAYAITEPVKYKSILIPDADAKITKTTETITVPAGEFSCRRVTYTKGITLGTGDLAKTYVTTHSEWYSTDVPIHGLVKQEHKFEGTILYQRELLKLHVEDSVK